MTFDLYSLSMSANMKEGDLQMRKTVLRGVQKMSDAAYVADAQRWASALVSREHRGPGDTVEAAMFRAQQKWGIDRSTFWSLRYRPPQDVMVGVYMRLKAAYQAECERQEARLAHELMLTKAVRGNAAPTASMDAAETLLGQGGEALK